MCRTSTQWPVRPRWGVAMQNLVVDREEDGKAVIQYLKRRDGGRATILPPQLHPAGELRECGEPVQGARLCGGGGPAGPV